MANVRINLTCSDYARVMLLQAGVVRPEGIDFTLVTKEPATWEEKQELMRRALHDPAIHGGEASMAAQLRRIETDTGRISRYRSLCCAISWPGTCMFATTAALASPRT
jgi:hypothetical protein